MDQRFSSSERHVDAPSEPLRESRRAAIRLVGARTLALDLGGGAVPDDWREAVAALGASHRITIEHPGTPRPGGLRQVARWAAGQGQPCAAPVFAPWQAFAPASLQNPLARAALPQAAWLASYLFDPAAPKGGAAGALDIMLASPHPAACLENEAGHPALPRKGVFDAMIAAVRAEQRERLAIIVPSHARSMAAQRLLAADRVLRQGDIAIEIIAIEEAIGRLIASAHSWDAIIVLPELRGIIAAVLAQISGIAGPWPLLWFGSGLVRVSSELLRETSAALPLDAAVLMQALAQAARHGGLAYEAQHLARSWMRLRESGAGTHTRPALSPYGTRLDDAAFIALAAADHLPAAGRPLPGWKALDPGTAIAKGGASRNQPVSSPVALSLVRS